jgi:hypothetical protein
MRETVNDSRDVGMCVALKLDKHHSSSNILHISTPQKGINDHLQFILLEDLRTPVCDARSVSITQADTEEHRTISIFILKIFVAVAS